MTELLRRLAAATEPDAGVTDRLRARVSPPSPGPLLQGVGEVDPGVVARLQAGARARRARPRRGPLALGGGFIVLLAVGWMAKGPAGEAPMVDPGNVAVGAPGVAEGVTGAPSAAAAPPAPSHREPSAAQGTAGAGAEVATTRPVRPTAPPVGAPRAPTVPPPDPHPAGPSPSTATALPRVAPATRNPFASLRLSAGGVAERAGRVSTVRWEVGTLTAALAAPGEGELHIVTREGWARLEEGDVAVTRDRLGTRVVVRGGSVQVTCDGAPARGLVAGERVECLPTRPLGWLGRAEALHEAGAPLAEVLSATAAGRAAGADDPAYGELVALEVDVLRAAGDLDAARAAAARYPARGPRASEMTRLQKP